MSLLKSGITHKTIHPSEILKSVQDKSAGGTVLFLGTIRNRTSGKEVKGLEYEIYQRMAERRMSELEREIKQNWQIKAIKLVHREGRLKTGDVSVAVAVSSEHRREAFEAARFAIERIKNSFPIWKKEVYLGGRRVWAKGTPIQSESRRRDCLRGQRRSVRQRRKTLVRA